MVVIFDPLEIDIIRDPVHNYIIINKEEKKLIDTEPVQRLRYLKQTPSASFVYPGANHTRFEHSLGVCHLIGKIAKSLKDSGSISKLDKWEEDVQKARIAALLHDIGHGPFSHTFEFFLKSLKIDLNHQKMTKLIIEKRLANEIKQIFGLKDEDVQDISNMAVGEIMTVGDAVPRLYLAPMVGGQIDADKMDFLQRDALHTGTIEYGSIDVERLVLNLKLIEDDKGVKKIGILDRAAYAIESLFLSRYQMYRAVYYHRTVRSYDLMLCDALKSAKEEIDELKCFEEGVTIEKLKKCDTFLPDYLDMDDYSMMGELKKLARKNGYSKINEIMHKIATRQHYRHAYGTIFTTDNPFLTQILLGHPEIIAEKETEIKSEAQVDKEVRIDVPYEFEIVPVPLDHSQITIIDDKGIEKSLKSYIQEEGKEKMPILHKIEWLGGLFVVLNVFTDADNKEDKEKIREASIKCLGRGETLNI